MLLLGTFALAPKAEVLNPVTRDCEAATITRYGHEPVTIISLVDSESRTKPIYLMCSLANAQRLLKSIEELEVGEGTARRLIND